MASVGERRGAGVLEEHNQIAIHLPHAEFDTTGDLDVRHVTHDNYEFDDQSHTLTSQTCIVG